MTRAKKLRVQSRYKKSRLQSKPVRVVQLWIMVAATLFNLLSIHAWFVPTMATAVTPVDTNFCLTDVIPTSDETIVRPIGNFATGCVWEDVNGNGTWQPGEPPMGNIKILSTHGESTTTNIFGYYQLALTPGTHQVIEATPAGWVNTNANNVIEVTVPDEGTAAGVHFGNFERTSISGIKFNDLNVNGNLNSGEPGIPNWPIELWQFDQFYFDHWADYGATPNDGYLKVDFETPPVTDGSGQYIFSDLGPGRYRVVEDTTNPMYQQSMPAAPGWYTDIAPLSGTAVTNRNFGNYQVGSVAGTAYHDLNGNGLFDSGEQPLPNVAIRLAGHPDVLSAADGTYVIPNVPVGTHQVIGVNPTAPVAMVNTNGGTMNASGGVQADVPVTVGAITPNVDFFFYGAPDMTISVVVDPLVSALSSVSAAGLSAPTPVFHLWHFDQYYFDHWADYGVTPNDGYLLDEEALATAQPDGTYTFPKLAPGKYRVTADVDTAIWIQTSPNPTDIVPTSGGSLSVVFNFIAKTTKAIALIPVTTPPASTPTTITTGAPVVTVPVPEVLGVSTVADEASMNNQRVLGLATTGTPAWSYWLFALGIGLTLSGGYMLKSLQSARQPQRRRSRRTA